MDLDSAAQEWQAHGFVIFPGFVPAAELKAALDELPAMYPTAEDSMAVPTGGETGSPWTSGRGSAASRSGASS